MKLIEKSYGKFEYVAASDECGRGPLAGPVIACSIGLPFKYIDSYVERLRSVGVGDSKKLHKKKIDSIVESLGLTQTLSKGMWKNKRVRCRNFENIDIFLSSKSNTYIDKHNILVASLEAMKSSFYRLKNLNLEKKTLWLIDGPYAPPFKRVSNLEIIPLIKGDSKSCLIGLSSVIAKYYRDKYMEVLEEQYPGYGFSAHKGYPTKNHYESLKIYGPSSVHRKSFRGVLEK